MTTSRSNDRRGTKAERLSLRRGGPLPPRRRDDATTHELDRAGTRRDRHHVVDAPPAAPVELRQARREAGRLGDVDAVLQLPAALARPDRAPAESERESLDHHSGTPAASAARNGAADSTARLHAASAGRRTSSRNSSIRHTECTVTPRPTSSPPRRASSCFRRAPHGRSSGRLRRRTWREDRETGPPTDRRTGAGQRRSRRPRTPPRPCLRPRTRSTGEHRPPDRAGRSRLE